MPPIRKKREPEGKPSRPTPRPVPSPPRPPKPTEHAKPREPSPQAKREPEHKPAPLKPVERRAEPHKTPERKPAPKAERKPGVHKPAEPKPVGKGTARKPSDKRTPPPRLEPRANPTFWITVGATYFSGCNGAFGNLCDGRFYYAELGTARRTDGGATGHGWIAAAFGLPGELPAGAGLWVRYGGRTTYMVKKDRGYGQGGDGVTSDRHYAVDLHDEVARYLRFPGKADIEISPNFSVPTHGAPASPGQPPNPYVNPLAKASVRAERIDQGVDYAGTGEIVALANGNISANTPGGWAPYGNYLEYKITQPGQFNGAYVYVAEGIEALVPYGAHVVAGQPIARLIPGWRYGIEMGFAAGDGHDHTYYYYHDGPYREGTATRPGIAFDELVKQLGGPGGHIEGAEVGKWPEYTPNGAISGAVVSEQVAPPGAFLGLSPEAANTFAQAYDWGGSVKHKWSALHDGVSKGASHVKASIGYAYGVTFIKPSGRL